MGCLIILDVKFLQCDVHVIWYQQSHLCLLLGALAAQLGLHCYNQETEVNVSQPHLCICKSVGRQIFHMHSHELQARCLKNVNSFSLTVLNS